MVPALTNVPCPLGTLALPPFMWDTYPAAAEGPALKKKDLGEGVGRLILSWLGRSRPGQHWPVNEDDWRSDVLSAL